MNYQNEIRNNNYRIFVLCLLALVALAFWVPSADAYPDYTGCGACHGDFRASNYVSLMDGQSWGNLHDLHRTTMLGGDCNVCHSGASRKPVYIASSAGGTGLQAISCMGCHGRSQDAGHDDTSGGLGAGLRQHHTRAGQTDCQGCHSDATPANYTPVGENVKPPYYATPGTGHPNMPTDPCNANPTATGKETFAGSLLGLDNDGNDLYDLADPACAAAPSKERAAAPPPGDRRGRARHSHLGPADRHAVDANRRAGDGAPEFQVAADFGDVEEHLFQVAGNGDLFHRIGELTARDPKT